MTTPERQNPAIAFRVPGAVNWRSPIAATPSDTAAQAETRKVKEELKNALLASLQMQHVVVLAGSGCSRSAGGPTMRDLWNAAVGEEPSDAAKATACKVNHALDNRNIELFLSKVEAFLQVTQDKAVSAFLDSSKQAILATCTSFWGAPGFLGH